MKIIAGSLRNRTIIIPKSSTVRPTSARLRGQVFNICQGCLEGAHALDLFAGSGAMGIEALSRGAERCVFVEQDHRVAEVLKNNLRSLNLQDKTRVLEIDALKAVRTLTSTSPAFSFVYIDPPYHLTEPLTALLEQIDRSLPLEDGANLFLETRAGSFTPPQLPSLSLLSHRISGDSDLWHFAKTLR
jgi:16S rRNA (guanine966-N2)-methyltransferase